MRAQTASFIGLSCTFAIAIASPACSSKKTTPGELMVVLETDMVMPKDIDDVDVQVLQGDESLFSQSLATGAHGLRLPATLSLLAGRDATSPVRIRAIGRQHGTARMLREVTTSVPADRVAMLRVPLTWWCDGSATASTGAGVTSTCSDGRTCIAGSCQSPVIDSSTLPAFDAAQVFGGSADPASGACFDASACFAGATQVVIDTASCSIPKPPSDGAGINVAVLLPPGSVDGFCDDRGCVLPLDGDGETAWRSTDGATIALPPVVCQRIESGTQLAALRSTSCASKTQRTPSCGPWSSVGSSDAGADTTPVTLAGPLNQVRAIALTSDRVAWATPLAVQIVPTGGGATTTLAPVTADIVGFTANADSAFIADSTQQGRIVRVPADGSPSSTLATGLGNIAGIASDANAVYVGANFGTMPFRAIPLDGSPVVSLAPALSTNDELGTSLLVDANDIVFAVVTNLELATYSIQAIPTHGGTPRIVASLNGPAKALAMDASSVYWTEDDGTVAGLGSVYRAPRSGGSPVVLAAKQLAVQAVAVDDTYVYWTLNGTELADYRDGAVKKTLKAGGAAVVPVSVGESSPTFIAVDDTSIVWGDEGSKSGAFIDGAIRRAFK